MVRTHSGTNLCRSWLLPADELSWAGGGNSHTVDVVPAWWRWRRRFVGLLWVLVCLTGFVLRLWWFLQACFDWQVGFCGFAKHCCSSGLFRLGFWSFVESYFSALLNARCVGRLVFCNKNQYNRKTIHTRLDVKVKTMEAEILIYCLIHHFIIEPKSFQCAVKTKELVSSFQHSQKGQ